MILDLKEYYSFIREYGFSYEFENCLKDILLQSENTLFSELSKLHFQLSGGVETESINKIFKLLDLSIIFTDIIDDIEDKEITKWGKEENILINASTALMSIVMLELNSLDFPFRRETVQLFFQYLISAADGQHHDLLNNVVTEEIQIKITMKKSGSLIALACTLGEVLATGKYREGLEECASYMGVIAQLNNDYEDLMTQQKDIGMKKINLPILYLLKDLNPMFTALREFYQDQYNVIPPIYIAHEELEACGLPIYISFMKSKYRQLAIDLLNELYPKTDILHFEKFIQ